MYNSGNGRMKMTKEVREREREEDGGHEPRKRKWLHVTAHHTLSTAALQRWTCLFDRASICLRPCTEHSPYTTLHTGSHAGPFGPCQRQLCWWDLYLQTAAMALGRVQWKGWEIRSCISRLNSRSLGDSSDIVWNQSRSHTQSEILSQI